MTREQALRIVCRHYGFAHDTYRLDGSRQGNRVAIVATKRPLKPWQRPDRLVLGLADSWAEAARQACSGFVRRFA